MAINVTLYSTSSDTTAVTKTLSGATTYSCTLRGECSILQPVIMLEASSLTSFNYAYIADFGRYYFIDNIDIIRTGLWRITLSVDVLMSYASGIRGLKATVARQQTKSDGYLPDNKYRTKSYHKVVTKMFPNSFSHENFSRILVVSGRSLS